MKNKKEIYISIYLLTVIITSYLLNDYESLNKYVNFSYNFLAFKVNLFCVFSGLFGIFLTVLHKGKNILYFFCLPPPSLILFSENEKNFH